MLTSYWSFSFVTLACVTLFLLTYGRERDYDYVESSYIRMNWRSGSKSEHDFDLLPWHVLTPMHVVEKMSANVYNL